MFFSKYYSLKTQEYINKAVLSEGELKILRTMIKEYMPEIDYNKLLIRRFNIENEYKFKNSPNFIGMDVLDKISESGKKYYTLELTDSEKDEMYEQLFKALLRLRENYDMLNDTFKEAMANLLI